MKHHVSGEFSDRDHVGGFLQLDGLLVDKLAPVVEDDVWVEGAVLGLAFRGGAGSVSGIRCVGCDSRITPTRQRSLLSTQSTRHFDRLDGSAALALQVKLRGSGRQLRGVDDDAG